MDSVGKIYLYYYFVDHMNYRNPHLHHLNHNCNQVLNHQASLFCQMLSSQQYHLVLICLFFYHLNLLALSNHFYLSLFLSIIRNLHYSLEYLFCFLNSIPIQDLFYVILLTLVLSMVLPTQQNLPILLKLELLLIYLLRQFHVSFFDEMLLHLYLLLLLLLFLLLHLLKFHILMTFLLL